MSTDMERGMQQLADMLVWRCHPDVLLPLTRPGTTLAEPAREALWLALRDVLDEQHAKYSADDAEDAYLEREQLRRAL